MATKLGSVRIYNEKLPSITSQGPLFMWGLARSKEILDVISPLQQGIWASNLARRCLTMRNFDT